MTIRVENSVLCLELLNHLQLCNLLDHNQPGSSVHGIFPASILILLQSIFPKPRIEPVSPASPALAGGFFTIEPPGNLQCHQDKVIPCLHKSMDFQRFHVLSLVTQSSPTLCDPMDCSPPGSSIYGNSPGKNPGMGCHAFLQGIFPTWGLNPGLLHCRCILFFFFFLCWQSNVSALFFLILFLNFTILYQFCQISK